MPRARSRFAAMDDGAALRIGDRWLVMTTDSHVVQPLFFPGGDIGRLAVSGTVNDLAMMGATDVLALTCAVIIEEGFSRADLSRIQRSMRRPASEAGARIVTGDTKVMGKGELDGIVINTTGVALTDRVVPDSAPARRRSTDRHRHDRRSRHGRDGEAARAGDRRPARLRRQSDQRAGARGARRGARRGRRDEGSDARRRGLGAARNGGEEPRRRHRRRAGAAGHRRRARDQRTARHRSAARRQRRQGGARRAAGRRRRRARRAASPSARRRAPR